MAAEYIGPPFWEVKVHVGKVQDGRVTIDKVELAIHGEPVAYLDGDPMSGCPLEAGEGDTLTWIFPAAKGRWKFPIAEGR